MRTTKRILLAAVLVCFCAPLFVGLGRADLNGDEPIYSYAVDQMLQNGDWMTPRYIPQQTPFIEKPPLKFWLIAAGIRLHVLPADEFGHRFWDALFGAIAFLYVFALGTRLAGPVGGFIAVLVLFAHQTLLFEHGLRSNNMEAPLVVAYCGGMYHAIAWSETASRRARRWHPLAIAGWFTLGFMTKFVAVAFLPLVLLLLILGAPSWRARAIEDWRAWALAAVAALVLIAPWFLYQTVERGWELWRVILAEHVVQRMRVSIHPEHIQPWPFYWKRVYEETVGNGTALLILAGMLVVAAHTVRRRWVVGAALLLWFFLPMLAISFGRGKLYHYAYPFLPPLALAAGYGAVTMFRWAARLRVEWKGSIRNPAARQALVIVAAIAFAVALWTVVAGRFGIHAGEVTIFRNRSILRPLGLAVLCLVFAGRTRQAVQAMLAILVAAPLSGYLGALARLDDGRPQLQELRACLRQRFGDGVTPRVYGHGDPGQWRYVYYFLPIGWDNPGTPDDGRLLRDVTMAGDYEPVLLTAADYARFRQAHAVGSKVTAVEFDDRRLLLLPGRFASCAAGN